MQDDLERDNAQSIRDGNTSIASSRRSLAYRAVEEVAAVRTSLFSAEAEEQQTLARLANSRAECKVIIAELEAMQNSVKESLSPGNQQHTVQSAKMDAMEYRLAEMKDPLLQRELHMG